MSVKKEMFNGVIWSAVEKYSGLIISIIVSSVLARLISPEDFGVISVATIIINFLILFTDLGIGPAIIQNKSLTSKDLDAIFTFTLLGGILLSILLYIFANDVALFYKNQTLKPVTEILAIQLFFAALNIVPHAEMSKNKEFKKIAKRTLLLQVVTGIISCVVAYKTRSIFTLLISPIVTSIGIFFYNMRYYPRRLNFSMDLTPLKKIFSFSLYQFLFGFVNYFSRNLDNLLIGKYLGLSDLGFYDKAYRLMLLPMQNITMVVGPVLQPIFSDFQEDRKKMADYFTRIVNFMALLSFPIGILLFFSASEVITIFYGYNWSSAIPIFKILALSLPLQVLASPVGAIYQSANATKMLFYNTIINTFLTVSSFVFALLIFHNVQAVAWSFTVTSWLSFFINFYLLYIVTLKQSINGIVKILLLQLLYALGLVLLLILISKICRDSNIFLSISIKSAVTFIYSILVGHFTKQFDVKKIVALIKNKLNKSKKEI